MSDDSRDLARHVLVTAARLSSHARLVRLEDLELLSRESLRALLNTLRDAEQAIDREKRTFRPFPGGPRIRT